MTLRSKKLDPLFAAEITGIDMRRDTDAVTVAALIPALDDYAVCVVPHEIPLSNEEHIAFSALLGPMAITAHRAATHKPTVISLMDPFRLFSLVLIAYPEWWSPRQRCAVIGWSQARPARTPRPAAGLR